MKKILMVLLVTSLTITLSGCGKDEKENPAPVIDKNAALISGVDDVELTVGDTFDQLDGVTATDTADGDLTANIIVSGTVDLANPGNYTLTYTVTDSDGNVTTANRSVVVLGLDGCAVFQELIGGECVDIEPDVITIMHGAVYEIDPFHEAYSGTEQLTKQELQREVEAKYNVVINYEEYPANAGWGPSRITAIIQSSVSGEPMSDIYWITSDWVQQLADADAIADVTQYLTTTGANIDESYLEVGSYKGGHYGFEVGQVTIAHGLYYNADLVENLGVDNPTELYLDGDWNWSTFETWATDVQTQLSAQGDDMYALGGMLSYYAMNMIPLNGGSLINAHTGRVAFAQNPALETYDYLTNLYTKGLFELSPQYDAGSPEWMAGKVAMHPGSLWFLTADNRWGTLPFELGFVPYPVADDFDGEYISPVSGVAIMSIASGMTPEREALVFEVWNELQLWKTDQEEADAFELTLLTKFDDEIYIEAYLQVFDKTYLDLINAVGISAYGENGWTRNINSAIKTGTSRTVVDQIKPIYETALDDYIG